MAAHAGLAVAACIEEFEGSVPGRNAAGSAAMVDVVDFCPLVFDVDRLRIASYHELRPMQCRGRRNYRKM